MHTLDTLHLHLGQLADAFYLFIQRTTVPTHIHTPTAESTTQGDSASTLGEVRVRSLAQEHLDTLHSLGGA